MQRQSATPERATFSRMVATFGGRWKLLQTGCESSNKSAVLALQIAVPKRAALARRGKTGNTPVSELADLQKEGGPEISGGSASVAIDSRERPATNHNSSRGSKVKIKNLCIYRCKEMPRDFEAEQYVSDNDFVPCGQTEPSRVGFITVIDNDFAPEIGESYALNLRHQVRVLPAYVVNEATAKEVEKREIAESRKIGRKERTQIKDEVYFSLLPKAFTKDTDHMILMFPKSGLIMVEASSLKTAEMCLNAMRLAFGSLPVQRVQFSVPLEKTMKHNITSGIGQSFKVGCDIDLADKESTVKFKGVESGAHEARVAIVGRDVKRLSLSYQDAISFRLTSDFRLQGLSLSERMRGELVSQSEGDKSAEQRAELYLWAATLEKMVPELLKECEEIVQ